MAEPLTLLTLPVELLLEIIDTVLLSAQSSDNPSSTAYLLSYTLRSTCRTLHSLRPPPTSYILPPEVSNSLKTPRNEEQRIYTAAHLANLLEMEHWRCYTSTPRILYYREAKMRRNDTIIPPPIPTPHIDRLPPRSHHLCTRCTRLLPSRNFVISHVTSWRSKDAFQERFHAGRHATKKDPGTDVKLWLPIHRTCISCNVSNGTYTAKTNVLQFVTEWEDEAGGFIKSGVVCKRCNKFVEAKPQSVTALRRKCDDCREYRRT